MGTEILLTLPNSLYQKANRLAQQSLFITFVRCSGRRILRSPNPTVLNPPNLLSKAINKVAIMNDR